MILPLTPKWPNHSSGKFYNAWLPGRFQVFLWRLTLHTFTWLADHTALVVFVLHTGVSTIDYRLSRAAVEQALHSGSAKCYGMTFFLGQLTV
jgi:hypothetical protein